MSTSSSTPSNREYDNNNNNIIKKNKNNKIKTNENKFKILQTISAIKSTAILINSINYDPSPSINNEQQQINLNKKLIHQHQVIIKQYNKFLLAYESQIIPINRIQSYSNSIIQLTNLNHSYVDSFYQKFTQSIKSQLENVNRNMILNLLSKLKFSVINNKNNINSQNKNLKSNICDKCNKKIQEEKISMIKSQLRDQAQVRKYLLNNIKQEIDIQNKQLFSKQQDIVFFNYLNRLLLKKQQFIQYQIKQIGDYLSDIQVSFNDLQLLSDTSIKKFNMNDFKQIQKIKFQKQITNSLTNRFQQKLHDWIIKVFKMFKILSKKQKLKNNRQIACQTTDQSLKGKKQEYKKFNQLKNSLEQLQKLNQTYKLELQQVKSKLKVTQKDKQQIQVYYKNQVNQLVQTNIKNQRQLKNVKSQLQQKILQCANFKKSFMNEEQIQQQNIIQKIKQNKNNNPSQKQFINQNDKLENLRLLQVSKGKSINKSIKKNIKKKPQGSKGSATQKTEKSSKQQINQKQQQSQHQIQSGKLDFQKTDKDIQIQQNKDYIQLEEKNKKLNISQKKNNNNNKNKIKRYSNIKNNNNQNNIILNQSNKSKNQNKTKKKTIKFTLNQQRNFTNIQNNKLIKDQLQISQTVKINSQNQNEQYKENILFEGKSVINQKEQNIQSIQNINNIKKEVKNMNISIKKNPNNQNNQNNLPQGLKKSMIKSHLIKRNKSAIIINLNALKTQRQLIRQDQMKATIKQINQIMINKNHKLIKSQHRQNSPLEQLRLSIKINQQNQLKKHNKFQDINKSQIFDKSENNTLKQINKNKIQIQNNCLESRSQLNYNLNFSSNRSNPDKNIQKLFQTFKKEDFLTDNINFKHFKSILKSFLNHSKNHQNKINLPSLTHRQFSARNSTNLFNIKEDMNTFKITKLSGLTKKINPSRLSTHQFIKQQQPKRISSINNLYKIQEILAKCEELNNIKFSQQLFDKSDLFLLFQTQMKAYQYQKHKQNFKTAFKLYKLNQKQEEYLRRLYKMLILIKSKNETIYHKICSFIRYPYQTANNAFDSINLTKDISEETFMKCFKKILTLKYKFNYSKQTSPTKENNSPQKYQAVKYHRFKEHLLPFEQKIIQLIKLLNYKNKLVQIN